jgi:hypothetical protein
MINSELRVYLATTLPMLKCSKMPKCPKILIFHEISNIKRYTNMKFLNKDTISSLLLGLLIAMSSSAVLAAGGQGSGAGQSGGAGSAATHKMEQPKNRNQYEHQKGRGGDTGKGEQTGEVEQAQIQEQSRERVEITIQGAE